MRLRVQDIDFDFKQITVCDDKGKKKRVTPLANNLMMPLQQHLARVALKEGFLLISRWSIRRLNVRLNSVE